MKRKLSNVLIIGATSAIAAETAKLFARDGAGLMLAGRDQPKLQALADDARVRGASRVITFTLDVNDFDRHKELMDTMQKAFSTLDAVLIAHGSLPDQPRTEQDVPYALNHFNTNAVSVIALLIRLGQYFEAQKHGSIAVISSVAGDRGRQSNYLYGSAKAAASTFLSGLRSRLHKSGVQVLTIKPGFVDTPMTAHLPKNRLFARADKVAKGIYDAIIGGKKDVVYLPWFWKWIMRIVRLIPEQIFIRLSL